MLFVIHALDKPGALQTRLAHYDAHKAFLSDTSKFGVNVLMSGPLVEDDGATAKGSMFVVEAADRATVEAFHHADPFHAIGIWAQVSITAFIKRQG